MGLPMTWKWNRYYQILGVLATLPAFYLFLRWRKTHIKERVEKSSIASECELSLQSRGENEGTDVDHNHDSVMHDQKTVCQSSEENKTTASDSSSKADQPSVDNKTTPNEDSTRPVQPSEDNKTMPGKVSTKPDRLSEDFQTTPSEDSSKHDQPSEDNQTTPSEDSSKHDQPSEDNQTTPSEDSSKHDQPSEDNQTTPSEDSSKHDQPSEDNQTTPSENSTKPDRLSEDQPAPSEDSTKLDQPSEDKQITPSEDSTKPDQPSEDKQITPSEDSTKPDQPSEDKQTTPSEDSTDSDQLSADKKATASEDLRKPNHPTDDNHTTDINNLIIEGMSKDDHETITELEKKVQELFQKMGTQSDFANVYRVPTDTENTDSAQVVVELSNTKDKAKIMMAAEKMAESSCYKEESPVSKHEENKKKQQSNEATEQMTNPTSLSRDVEGVNAQNATGSTAYEMEVSSIDNQDPTVSPLGKLANRNDVNAHNPTVSTEYETKVSPSDNQGPTVSPHCNFTNTQEVNTHNPTVSTADFVASSSNNQEPTMSPHGNITNLHAKIKTGNWVLEKAIGHKGHYGGDIAICPNGNIAVTDHDASEVKIYNSNGQYTQSMDTTQGGKQNWKHSWKSSIMLIDEIRYSQVAVNPNGCYYVTDAACYVKVFNAQCQYQSQFPAVSPNNKTSDKEHTELRGIAIDGNGHILVGACNKKYISKHEQDGRHIGSIKVSIKPCVLSVCRNHANGGIVVLNIGIFYPWSFHTGTVQVIDPNGQLLHTLNAPPGVSWWRPTGVCCYEDVIFIANNYSSNSSGGIYCFSMTGEYLGCVTNEVRYPYGLAITADGNRLMVVDEKYAKIFKTK